MTYEILVNGKRYRVELTKAEDRWLCRVNGSEVVLNAAQIRPRTLSVLIADKSFDVRQEGNSVFVQGNAYTVKVEDPRSWRGRKAAATHGEGPQQLIASMPGKIVRVLAAQGEAITAGQGIAVIEAMKMQNEIKSPRAGTLKRLLVQPGMNVSPGEILAVVE